MKPERIFKAESGHRCQWCGKRATKSVVVEVTAKEKVGGYVRFKDAVTSPACAKCAKRLKGNNPGLVVKNAPESRIARSAFQ